MTPFYYQPATTSDAWRQTGYVKELLQGYFANDGGFLIETVIAVAVALVFSLVFYAFMGRKFGLSKLSVWLVMLVLSGIFSFGITAFSTGTLTGKETGIGITATFKDQKDAIKNKEERRNYENTIEGTMTAKRADRQKADDNNKKAKKPRRIKNPNYLKFADNPVAKTVSILNIFYTMLLFWLFSLFFKSEQLKITKFAFDIPHKWPQRKN